MAANTAVTLTNLDVNDPTGHIELKELPIPTPGPGEVVVRLTLRPVNPADIFTLQGVYPGVKFTDDQPKIPGLEGTGVVHALGEGTQKFSIGQRVVGTPFPSVEHGCGTYQNYIVAPEDRLMAVPDSVSDETAAQFWVNPVTVLGMFKLLAVPQGEYLLQTAAGSVLGRQMIQLCKSKGVKTINVVRRAAQIDELKALGADEVVVSSEEDIAARVEEITGGRGAFAAIECVGGDLFATIISSVRPNGTAIIYGAMGGFTITVNIPDLLFRNKVARGFWLGPYMNSLSPEDRTSFLEELMSLLDRKVLTPYSGVKFPLEDVVEAVNEARKEARGGKVFLESY